ncbi:unnamed protein product, partial [Ectocarpus sp. 13 AM-2016]
TLNKTTNIHSSLNIIKRAAYNHGPHTKQASTRAEPTSSRYLSLYLSLRRVLRSQTTQANQIMPQSAANVPAASNLQHRTRRVIIFNLPSPRAAGEDNNATLCPLRRPPLP